MSPAAAADWLQPPSTEAEPAPQAGRADDADFMGKESETRVTTLDRNDVAAMSKAAGLPLSETRLDIIAPELAEFISAANELNTKMADPRWRGLTPIVRFSTPAAVKEPDDATTD